MSKLSKEILKIRRLHGGRRGPVRAGKSKKNNSFFRFST